MEQRKILVLYTGGTIGMKKNEDGVYVPVKEEFLKYICNISKLNSSDCKKRGEFIIGNRTTKVDTGSYDGFSSPNFEPLATVNQDEKTVLGSDIIRERTNNPNNLRKNIRLVIKNNLTEKIGVLFCTPTTNQVHIRRSLEGAKGLVILTFGNGNMNTDAEGVIETLRDAIKKGTVILNVTQCLKGSVMSNYEPGNDLHNIGVISGNDITTEAAYAKMVVLLQNNPADIFKISVHGEMTVK
ncbi:hypothetical protein GWI33_005403 [Rhynchophorus ferrugineus]|uniref:asparaginase n=1 Tax=Rhynchophorus ferrugineus TaxID=354439 RepID=A0A834MG39_RHYFE|nr:hypothetical protein GWI33_005403 [Rhynchophorus ferrugineus]